MTDVTPLTPEEEAQLRHDLHLDSPWAKGGGGWPHQVVRLLATLDAERAARVPAPADQNEYVWLVERAYGPVYWTWAGRGEWTDDPNRAGRWKTREEAAAEASRIGQGIPVQHGFIRPGLPAPADGLDVEPTHEHRWTDAPDDENGWYCPGCGLIEYPSRTGPVDAEQYAALGEAPR